MARPGVHSSARLGHLWEGAKLPRAWRGKRGIKALTSPARSLVYGGTGTFTHSAKRRKRPFSGSFPHTSPWGRARTRDPRVSHPGWGVGPHTHPTATRLLPPACWVLDGTGEVLDAKGLRQCSGAAPYLVRELIRGMAGTDQGGAQGDCLHTGLWPCG